MHNARLRLAPLSLLPLLALAAGCNTQPTTITGGGPADPTADQIKAAPPVKLPPALLATKSYRCKDNSLIYVDWFNDQTTANLKTKKDGATIHLVAPAAGQAMVGEGHELTGNATATAVTYKKAGGASQSCDG